MFLEHHILMINALVYKLLVLLNFKAVWITFSSSLRFPSLPSISLSLSSPLPLPAGILCN